MKKIITLNNLPIGKKAIIINIDNKSNLKRRFHDLGIMNGSIIQCEFKAPFNDPTAYLVKECTIAIREDDSKYIKVLIDE